MAAAGKSNKSYERNRDESAAMFSNADLKRLIFPLVIEQALALTVGMADVMMVSYAGEAAVSGVSLVDMINVLLIHRYFHFYHGADAGVSEASAPPVFWGYRG